MNSLDELTYLDALLLMCLHYQEARLDPESTRQDLKEALKCIRDCERRQMELSRG
jgi:hypothetical protein